MGYDRWYLHVDADERLVFDGAPAAGRPGRGLAELVRFAEARRPAPAARHARRPLPAGPLLAPEARRADRLAPEARDLLFDADGYAEALCLERVSRKGGPRRRAFGFDPELTKYPLFHIRAGEVVVEPAPPAPLPRELPLGLPARAPARQVRPGLARPAERAAAEGNYWRRASSTARRWRRSPATPASRSPTPAAGATGRRPTSSPPG